MIKEFLLKNMDRFIHFLLCSCVSIIMFFIFLRSLIKAMIKEPFINSEMGIIFIFCMGIGFTISLLLSFKISRGSSKLISDMVKMTIIAGADSIAMIKNKNNQSNKSNNIASDNPINPSWRKR